ncbi:alpha-L-rhamnosidase [Nocardioides immobilis]|uniref:Alpha-L-rhamnosidase n=1 Tax=Nocardioides immobilis TaxID=2049295 RepID=A0A417XZ59_9ACTN|nr:glycosyl hydrolase [Nocardioides immobilis]RHW25653.1 alpha-L-rhamnosidase [Nocardioides immobilis]
MTEPTPGARLNRRSLFGAAAATIGTAAVVGAAGSAVPPARAAAVLSGGLPEELAKTFRKPGTATAAGFRWWWPHGLVDPAEIAREVDQVADAGFGVLEVADVTHSLRARNIEIDTASHGWGTAPWVAGVKAALTRAAQRGVRIDITVGPSWPAAVSTITPDDDAACTELVHGQAMVAAGATYDAALPEPVVEAASGVTRAELVTVQAHRVTGYVRDRNGNVTSTILDPSSYVDLTGSVADEHVTWTAPADPSGATWVLLATWRRGSGQEPEAGPHTSPRSYVVDHFSSRGAAALIDLWERRVLDGELRALLRSAGGNLFEDSLEIETDATIWTADFLDEFETSRAYDLRPWLPVVLEKDEKYQFVLAAADPATADTLRTNEIRDDYNQVLSDLYLDHHLRPLQDFARGLGMGIRIQPYGLETDTMQHAGIVDVPETESLGFKNLDDYRVMAAGRDLAGRKVLSCEAICYNGAAYNTTWGANSVSPTAQNQALFTINSIFVAGVNQLMIHGFPYAQAPDVTWPGFAAFSPYYNGAIGFGEAWGPRTPQWQHLPGIAAYLARNQLVLQTGAAKYDVAFWRHKGWASTGIGPQWITNNGTKLGWSHSFLSASLLEFEAAVVRDGRLAPDGPGYKALVVGPDSLRSNAVTMDVDGARRILALGRAGLPIVLIGSWAAVTPAGRHDAADVAEVRSLMEQVAALGTTRTVPEAEVGTALAALGVVRDVEHADSTLMHVRRVSGDIDVYYLANARHAENRRLNRVTQDVWLTATSPRAVPWLLDAWSGEVTRVAAYERSGSRVRVRVDLVPGQSTIVVLADPGDDPTRTMLQGAGQEFVLHGTRPALRTTTAGTHQVTWTGGRTTRTRVDRVREPVTPTTWTLELEDWRPADPADPKNLATTKDIHRVDLAALQSWSKVTGLEDVAGIGRYRTVVDLGADWTEDDGAVLELGEVNDTFVVRVNGEQLPPCDPLDPTIDLGHRLLPGRNEVEVEVASTLLNRLRVVTPSVYGVATRQSYGLTGPVRLVPYVDKVVPG